MPPDPLKTLGQRVRTHRESLRDDAGRPISQERFGDLIGLHRTYIGHVERGEVNVSLRNLIMISDGLGVDLGELVRCLGSVPPGTKRT